MPTPDLILALDQGTTSSRAILFDRAGEIVASAQRATTQHFPKPGWVNQDAREIWTTTLEVGREAISRSGGDTGRIAAIGIANQRETTILWDRASGGPVAPAIVWQSRQTAEMVEALVARGLTDTIQQTTGLVPDAYFSATKIAWLLDKDSELRRRAEAGDIAFGTVDSWLIWNLSGGRVHATDASNAARTMVYDIRRRDWSADLLSELAIPAGMMPEVRPNQAMHVEVESDVFGIPLVVMGAAGDQQAALFGQACFEPGQAKNTYGTGSFVLLNTGEQPTTSRHQLLTTVAWMVDSRTTYALEGAIFNTGSAVQWLRDGLGIIPTAPDVESLAASVDDSGGVAFVPALTGLGSPHWDPDARGTITGITRGTTSAHLARATLESIAFQTRDVVDAMVRDAGVPLKELRVDGGGAANNLLLQIQADILGVPVVRSRQLETTALGAAYLAGLGAGLWQDQADVATQWGADRRFEPAISEADRDRAYARWQDAVQRSRGWRH